MIKVVIIVVIILVVPAYFIAMFIQGGYHSLAKLRDQSWSGLMQMIALLEGRNKLLTMRAKTIIASNAAAKEAMQQFHSAMAGWSEACAGIESGPSGLAAANDWIVAEQRLNDAVRRMIEACSKSEQPAGRNPLTQLRSELLAVEQLEGASGLEYAQAAAAYNAERVKFARL